MSTAIDWAENNMVAALAIFIVATAVCMGTLLVLERRAKVALCMEATGRTETECRWDLALAREASDTNVYYTR